MTETRSTFELRSIGLPLLFIALVLGIPFGLATSPSIFRDGDVSWQVAAGEWIIRNGRIPTADPFSFTAAGHPWVAMEWLSEIVLAGAFRLAGYAGLATIVAAAAMATFAIIFFHLQRRASPLVIAATLLALSVALAPFALARPHMLAWPLLAGWTCLLLSAGKRGRPPPLWSALLLVLWTNVHASFPLAILIGGAIALDTLIESKWARLRDWLIFGVVSLVALLLNANGLAGLEQPFRTSSLAMLPYIGEWHASTTTATPLFFGVLILGLGALLWSGVHVPVGRLLLLMLLLAMAFAHVRHQSSFIIVAVCIVPPLFRSVARWSPLSPWLAAAALPFLAFRLLMPLTPPDSPANPRSLIAAIPPALRSQPVFNDYTFGGPLILAGIRPYIDGRGEVYGDAFVIDYTNIADGDVGAFDRAAQRYGIQWVMLQRNEDRLLQALESSGKWRRIHTDQIGAIAVRSEPSPKPAAASSADPGTAPAARPPAGRARLQST
jgi:hypothetical protein